MEELEALAAGTKAIQLGYPGLTHLAAAWSSKLGMFRDVIALYYQVSPSAIAGMLGRIRTTLVEMVAELASEVPFDELPTQKQVDAAVQVYVNGSQNNSMNFGGSNYGVAGQGAGSRQTQQIGSQAIGVSETGLVELISRLRTALPEVDNPDDRADVEQALDDLEEAATEENPEPEKVRRRFRALERVTVALGSVFIREGVAEIADAVTGMLGS